MLGKLFTPAVKAVGGVAKTMFGSKYAREKSAAKLDAAIQKQYAAEFRENKTWFDSFVDGLNRLVRPTLTTYICFLVFVMPLVNLDLFMEIVTAYSAVPESLWALAGIVITFYFGDRMQYKNLQFKNADIKQIQKAKKQIDAMRPEKQDVDGLPWLDNPTVEKWKKANR